MDHSYAIENHTAERYLLQELDEKERDAYEEHFFSCSVCAEEIKTASEFLETAKHVVQEEVRAQLYGHAAHHSIWGSWLNWRSMLHPLPAMACALLVFVSGFSIYLNRFVIPELRQSKSVAAPVEVATVKQIENSKAFVVEESRAEGGIRISVPRGESFVLQFDIPPGPYESYRADIMTPAGIRKLSSKNISREEARNSIKLPVPSGTLEPGEYVLVVQGISSKGTESKVKGEPTRIPFQLNIQD